MPKPPPHTPAATAAPPRRSSPVWGLRISPSGVLCAGVLVLVGLAAINSEANLLLLVFGLGLGALVLSAAACMLMVGRLDAERVLPGAGVAGAPFDLTYVLRRRGRGRCWALQVGESPLARGSPRLPRGFIPWMERRAEQRLQVRATIAHRGRVRLRGIRLRSTFPFGLFSCFVDLPAPAQLVIYPSVGRMRRDLWRNAGYGRSSAGRSRSSITGGEEVYGIREYRAGDNPRWIHWRRTAHLGRLVIRELMPLQATQVLVVLDPWPEAAAGSQGRGWHRSRLDPTAERLISAAATAVCEGIERGHRVGLICRAAVPVAIAPGGGRGQRHRLLHELALMAPGAGQSLEQILAGIRWSAGWRSRCIFLSPLAGHGAAQAYGLLSARTELVTAVSAEGGLLDKVFDLAPVRQADPAELHSDVRRAG